VSSPAGAALASPVRAGNDGAATVSVRRAATPEFSLVGVTWVHDPAVRDTVARIRTRSATGGWGQWSELDAQEPEEDAGPAPGAQSRGGTEPLWTGPGVGVEAEVVTRSGAAPRDVRLDLIDPGRGAADAAVAEPQLQGNARAPVARPAVHSRADWCADERIRSWQPHYASTIRAATLHHTADTSAYTAAQVPAILRAIYRYHAVSRGWGDIGYNVIVDKFGRLWEGRAGGLSSTVIGAHAGGFNNGTVGVAMLGNYDTTRPTPAMVTAIENFLAWKFALFHLNPIATTTLASTGGGTSRYSADVSVRLPTIFGHRDVGLTACPGRYGYPLLPKIRSAVAQRLGLRGR
jgi:uncharacterized protein with LGFP repeats